MGFTIGNEGGGSVSRKKERKIFATVLLGTCFPLTIFGGKERRMNERMAMSILLEVI